MSVWCSSHVGLLGELDVSELLAGSHHVDVLDSHDTTTPLLAELNVVVELSLADLGEVLKIDEVFTADFSESNTGGGLHVAEFAEVGLSTDEAVRNILGATEGGEVHNELNRVDIVSNDHQLGLVLLNQGGHVVQTELHKDGLGSLVSFTTLSLGLESAGLLNLSLGHVTSQKLQKLGSYYKRTSMIKVSMIENGEGGFVSNAPIYLPWFFSRV